MGLINSIVSFFVEGGFWMYPILLVGAVGIAIAIERFVKLSMVETANKKMWDELHPVLVEGNFDAAREMTTTDESTVSKLLEAGLEDAFAALVALVH